MSSTSPSGGRRVGSAEDVGSQVSDACYRCFWLDFKATNRAPYFDRKIEVLENEHRIRLTFVLTIFLIIIAAAHWIQIGVRFGTTYPDYYWVLGVSIVGYLSVFVVCRGKRTMWMSPYIMVLFSSAMGHALVAIAQRTYFSFQTLGMLTAFLVLKTLPSAILITLNMIFGIIWVSFFVDGTLIVSQIVWLAGMGLTLLTALGVQFVRTNILLSREKRYNALLDGCREGVVLPDGENIADCNQEFEKMMGRSAAFLTGQSITDLIAREDQETFRNYLLRSSELDMVVMHSSLTSFDGATYPVEISMMRSPWLTGESFCTAISFRNISTLQQIQRALLDAMNDQVVVREKLISEQTNKNEARTEFIANTVHELRTPLNAVIGMTEVLRESRLQPDQEECVKVIKGASESLLTLVNDLLDLRKAETDNFQLEEINFNLNSTVNSAVQLVAERAQVDLAYSVSPRLPDILSGDPARYKQILLNYMSNAVKFTKRGYIVVFVDEATGVFCEPNEVAVCTRVVDTGRGIARDDLSKLFQPFAQLAASTAREFGGTGLGLAICSKIAQLMGGSCAVESKLGEGSQFSFTVKLRRNTVPLAPLFTPITYPLDALVLFPIDVVRLMISERLKTWGIRNVYSYQSPGQIPPGLAHVGIVVLNQGMVLDENQLGSIHHRRLVVVLTSRGANDEAMRSDSVRRKMSRTTVRALLKPLAWDAMYKCLTDHVRGNVTGDLTNARGNGGEPKPAAERSLRILVLDDATMNITVTTRLLKSLGYVHVEGATSGLSALAKHEARPYNIILCDLRMPQMDGIEFARRIQQTAASSDQPPPVLIGLSGETSPTVMDEAREAGMSDMLVKPVLKKQLADVLEKAAVAARVHRRSMIVGANAYRTRVLLYDRNKQNVDLAGAMLQLVGVEPMAMRDEARIVETIAGLHTRCRVILLLDVSSMRSEQEALALVNRIRSTATARIILLAEEADQILVDPKLAEVLVKPITFAELLNAVEVRDDTGALKTTMAAHYNKTRPEYVAQDFFKLEGEVPRVKLTEPSRLTEFLASHLETTPVSDGRPTPAPHPRPLGALVRSGTSTTAPQPSTGGLSMRLEGDPRSDSALTYSSSYYSSTGDDWNGSESSDDDGSARIAPVKGSHATNGSNGVPMSKRNGNKV